MKRTLNTELQSRQARAISRVVFTIDREQGKIVSVLPAVDSDEELRQLEEWIEAALILSDLIQPRPEARAAA